jgi:hypothetical protein
MAISRGPKIVTNGLILALDASDNNSFAAIDLPIKYGLVMWMDAADDSTFSYSSGTTVSQWRDKSGFNYHMVPVSAGPTRNAFLNSRKVLAFTTTQQIRNTTLSLISSANTVFVICRYTHASLGRERILTSDESANNWLLGNYGNGINRYYANGWVNLSYDTPDTAWRIYMGDWSGPSTDLANFYSNGTAGNTNNSDASQGPASLGINRYYGETSNCEVSEIIVFNRVLSATERKQVHTYLGQKWNISNTDRIIVDISGNNNAGSFGGAAGSQTVANMPVYDYYNKGAFKFFASNKYIKLGISTVVNQFAGDFTVSLWAMATGENSNYGNLIGDYYTAGTQTTNEWQIMMNNSSAFLNVYRHGTGYIINNTSSGFSANTWINVVLTRVGTAVTLYANNNVIGTATNSLVFGSATGSVNIGIDGNNSAEPFSGLISNVLIYRKGLSAVEVLQNYNAQKSKYTDAIVQQGLVLNLDAGNSYSYGGAGTIFYDVSPTALSWTINNATYNSSDPKYFSYNGSDTWLQSSTSAAYDSQTITMECWCYPNSLSQNGFLFEKGQVNTQYSMFFENPNFVFRTMGSVSNQSAYFTASTYLIVSVWNHIVCTYNGSSKIMYVNGIQVQSVAASGALPTGQTDQYIGRHSGGYFFNGRIGESRVYNIALSAAQVLQNYNATKSRFGL